MGLTWLDFILIVVLVLFAINGYRNGGWISAGRMLGFTLGAVLSFFLMPLTVSWVPERGWRVVTMIVITVTLVLLGTLMGLAIGRWVRLRVNNPSLRAIDKVLGAIINTAIAGALTALISFSITSVGVPGITPTLKNSRVIAVITGITPEVFRSAVANARVGVMSLDGADKPAESSQQPRSTALEDVPEPKDLVHAARDTTVRITGAAYECGQNQTGSGFAVSATRVLTNAHVVAGVDSPQVEIANGDVLEGEVVYFDPDDDLAIIDLTTADLPVLQVGDELQMGQYAYALGYPAGGPYQVSPAVVQAVGPATIPNIYDTDTQQRNIYQLSTRIKQGNSGGPLVNERGNLVGLVFAKAPNSPVGYAMTMEELEQLIDQADEFDSQVSTGECIQ